MIISRTPFRISFFGGGTDYPEWYRRYGGKVLGTTIDKYCYINLRHLPPFFKYKHRIVYSRVEHINNIQKIKHPAVRGVLSHLRVEDGLEIHHDGDLPARSGLGSSSAFTVGLIHAVKALYGEMISKQELAKRAIYIEREVLKENVGSQDQVLASMGGLNQITFEKDGSHQISPATISKVRTEMFQNHLMLFFTGFSRHASVIAKSQVENITKKRKQLKQMGDMVDEALSILGNAKTPITEIGSLMHDSWMLKRSLSNKVTNPAIDQIYETGMKAGAVGGKILGAGGGGFILFFVPPNNQESVSLALKKLVHVGFRFENNGSKIVLYEPNDFN